ncbi:MAG: hypothetical protein AAFX04_05760 [Pseudomonadota bacterium]
MSVFLAIALLAPQATAQMLDERPQPAIGETQFACVLIRKSEDGKIDQQIDLTGVVPAFPDQHPANKSLAMALNSKSKAFLNGRAMVNSLHASQWFREYQIMRRVDSVTYAVTLNLRSEGMSIAHVTHRDPEWGQEPYRYYAVGVCNTQFEPVSEIDS